MPEGPEIRRAADVIERVLKDQTIEKVQFGLSQLKKFQKHLVNHKVLCVETRGKALLTHFDHGYSIYSHNQLYGVWMTAERGRLPNTKRQLRLALHTKSQSALLYSASDISVWQTSELDLHPFLKKIGPDILNPDLNWRDISQRLQDVRFRNRSLSALYLDQQFLAGLGNYLRSEILFLSGLHPELKPSELTNKQLGVLARTTLKIAKRSYEENGVTLPKRDYNYSRRSGLSYEKSRFYVFGRANKPCRVCGQTLERTTLNGRRIYVCSNCQPA